MSHQSAKNAGAAERRLLPLSVWLCSDTTIANTSAATASDRDRSEESVCHRHRQPIGRELARHLITTCTRPGGLVAEAFTTSEVTLLVTAELGRRGLACVPHFALAQHLRARLRADLTADLLANVGLRPCRSDQIHEGLADQAGEIELLIAALPPYQPAGRPQGPGNRACRVCRAGNLPPTRPEIAAFLTGARRVLAPRGHLAVITTARHENGRLIDPAPWVIRHATRQGLSYIQHVIALRVPIEGDALVVQAGPADLAELRDAQTSNLPPIASVHADVCLFTAPQGAAR